MKINPDDYISQVCDEGSPLCQLVVHDQRCNKIATQEVYIDNDWQPTFLCDEHHQLMLEASKEEGVWFGDAPSPEAVLPECMMSIGTCEEL